MKKALIICCTLIASAGVARPAGAEGPDELALAARRVFKDACAGCHGPQLPKPKGRFGYVLDLKRLAANPEMVVPGKPGESELYEIIRRDEMPPSKPLSAAQKETVRAWIQAGAPPAPAEAEARAAGSESSDVVRRVLRGAGKFHLLLLHFPIALLVTAAAGELWASARGRPEPGPTMRFCVVGGAATAVVAAALGWAYAASSSGAGAPEALAWHRWVGTAAAAWSVATAFVVEHDARRGTRNRNLQQLMVLLGALLIGAAGHFGGTLVHGDIFSDW
jgi:mono/diheme cytochrome c family protein/uncharacterized membrane protein